MAGESEENLGMVRILNVELFCSTMCVLLMFPGASKQHGSFQVLRHCHPCALNPLQLHVGLPYLLQRSRSSGNHNMYTCIAQDQICSDGDGTALHLPLCHLHHHSTCLHYALYPLPNSGEASYLLQLACAHWKLTLRGRSCISRED